MEHCNQSNKLAPKIGTMFRSSNEYSKGSKPQNIHDLPRLLDEFPANKNGRKICRIVLDENENRIELLPIPHLSETPSEEETRDYVCNLFNIKYIANPNENIEEMKSEKKSSESSRKQSLTHPTLIPERTYLTERTAHTGKFNNDSLVNLI